MADPHVICALVKRRIESVAKIEAAHEGLRKMVLDLENLNAIIVQFQPDYQGEAIRPNMGVTQRYVTRLPEVWNNRSPVNWTRPSAIRPFTMGRD
jgi:hypothetical protein